MTCCPAAMGRKPSLAKFDCRCDFCCVASCVWCSILMSVYFPISGFKLFELPVIHCVNSETNFFRRLCFLLFFRMVRGTFNFWASPSFRC
jgi:hypothetical protein